MIRLAPLLLACLAAMAHAADFHRTYTVAAHTDAAQRDDYRTLMSGLSAGDVVTLTFLPPEGYTMVTSECRDYTPIGWQPIGGVGRYRVVIPANLPLASSHEAEFFGRLNKVPTSGGTGEPTPPPQYFWGVKGAVQLTRSHEGLGVDALRSPAADTAFAPANPTPANTSGGQATVSGEVGSESFTGSGGGRELGSYNGYLTSNPQITTKVLPPSEQKPCPQDGADQVTFVYRGVVDGIKLIMNPDDIAIDEEPDYSSVLPARRPYVQEQWTSAHQKTVAHEDHHRADAYRVGGEAADYLKTARTYGYAPTEPRARALALIAAGEFLGSGYMMRMRDRINQEAVAYDGATDHGFRTP